MIKPTVNVDPKVMRHFNATINEMIAVSGEPAEQVIRQQARLLAKDASWWTDRKGFKKTVKAKHDKSIEDKVNRIYRDPLQLLDWVRGKFGVQRATELEEAIKSKKVVKVREMLEKFFGGKNFIVIKWDKGALHKRWKKNPKSKTRVYLVGGEKSKNAYIRRQQRNIGNAKAGWARAAEKIGGVKNPTKGIPAWAKKKKHKTKGIGNMLANGGPKNIATITNLSKYGLRRETMNQALRQRIFQTKKVMKAIMERNAKQATRDFNKNKRFYKQFL